MTLRLRFLLDTNVLIPLQDSLQVLEGNLANFVRLAHVGGHQLMYHPANIADFERDQDPLRRGRNLQRIKAFPALSAPAACPWNDPRTSPNDACDNELFLKAAFRYATENACEHIFITARAEAQDYLIRMLQDFGFAPRGQHHDDVVLVKEHPTREPAKDGLSPLDFARRYFPHFRSDATVQKFLVPVQPRYHDILFPDFLMAQRRLFSPSGHVGNAIRLAYLCHAPVKSIQPGDVVLFYRTDDEKTVTTIGVVDRFEISADSAEIASLVSRRTVYSLDEIEKLARQPTKVILFRLIGHFPAPVSYQQMLRDGVVSGPIQSIRKVDDVAFSSILARSRS